MQSLVYITTFYFFCRVCSLVFELFDPLTWAKVLKVD